MVFKDTGYLSELLHCGFLILEKPITGGDVTCLKESITIIINILIFV